VLRACRRRGRHSRLVLVFEGSLVIAPKFRRSSCSLDGCERLFRDKGKNPRSDHIRYDEGYRDACHVILRAGDNIHCRNTSES